MIRIGARNFSDRAFCGVKKLNPAHNLIPICQQISLVTRISVPLVREVGGGGGSTRISVPLAREVGGGAPPEFQSHWRGRWGGGGGSTRISVPLAREVGGGGSTRISVPLAREVGGGGISVSTRISVPLAREVGGGGAPPEFQSHWRGRWGGGGEGSKHD